MARREEVVSVVAMYDTGRLSWSFAPDQIRYQFDTLGIEGAKAEMRRQLELALERAESTYEILKRGDSA